MKILIIVLSYNDNGGPYSKFYETQKKTWDSVIVDNVETFYLFVSDFKSISIVNPLAGLYNLTKNRNSVKIEKSGYTYIRQISKTGKTKYIITKHSKKCINKHRRLTDENFYEKNNNPCLTRHSVL